MLIHGSDLETENSELMKSGEGGTLEFMEEKRTEIWPRTHLALTHPAPLYQHLLANAGEYKMSGGES